MFIGSVFTMYLQAEDGPKLYKKLRAIMEWLLKKSNRGTKKTSKKFIYLKH